MSRAIELLLEMILKKEEEARNAYLLAIREKESGLRNLEAINNYREIYTGELNNAGRQIMNTGTLTQYNNFISRLDTASEDQVLALKKADTIIEEKKYIYMQIQAKRKGLEKLLEKQAEKIADINQCGRQSNAENLAERFELFKRRCGEVHRALTGFKVNQR